MSFHIVPLRRRNFDFFDRQRDRFSDWVQFFDDDWKRMSFEDSRSRFNSELERMKRDLFRMDTQSVKLEVSQPFVTDPEGNKKFSLRFNCSKFKPEEITIKTQDNRLTVHAIHVEESQGRKLHKEFTREYSLPANVDPSQLTSHLTSDGVLFIEAPVQDAVEAPKEHLIPIERLEKGDADTTDDKKDKEKETDEESAEKGCE